MFELGITKQINLKSNTRTTNLVDALVGGTKKSNQIDTLVLKDLFSINCGKSKIYHEPPIKYSEIEYTISLYIQYIPDIIDEHQYFTSISSPYNEHTILTFTNLKTYINRKFTKSKLSTDIIGRKILCGIENSSENEFDYIFNEPIEVNVRGSYEKRNTQVGETISIGIIGAHYKKTLLNFL